MFRTRASLHQKAYQHKSVIAAERMYVLACMQHYSMALHEINFCRIVLAICAMKELCLIKPWTRYVVEINRQSYRV
jgi:hypothetical protein